VIFPDSFLENLNIMKKNNLSGSQIRTEITLKESEQRYRTIMMSVGDGVIATDIEGRVEMMNPVAEELTGWKQEKAQGKLLEEIFHIINEETRKTVENPVRRVISEGTVIGLANHSVLIARDGTEHPIADSGAPIRNEKNDITGVVLVFRDQTQERIAQKALQESERKFRETVKYLDEGYYCVTPEGLLLDYNQAFIRILGFEPTSDMKGVKLPDFWQNTDDRKIYLEELITKGFIRNFQINAKKLNGEKVVVIANSHMVKDEKGSLVRIEGTFTDFTELKLMEAALKENESKYRSLFENAQIGMYRSKIDGSAFLDVNLKAAEIFGFTREELLGMPANIRWANTDDRDNMMRLIKEHGGILENYEVKVHAKNGEVMDLLASIELHVNEGYLDGTMVDITERKRAVELLKESEERFRGVFESNMLGTLFWDANGDIIAANDAFLEIVGYSREDLISGVLKWKELTPPKYDKIDEEKLKELAKRGKIDPFEKEYIHKSGRLVPIIISAATLSGSNTSGVAIILDITQRKQTEEALRESRETYYYLYENSPVGMYHTKIDGSGIIEINDSACEMLGFKKEELIGQPSAIRWADPNRRGEILKIMGEHGVATNFDADILKKDGTIISCLLSMKIFKEEGYIEGFIVNITDRKRAEETLRESEARYRTLVENIPQGIFMKDHNYKWVSINENFARSLGVSPNDVVGKVDRDLFPAEIADKYHADDIRVLEKGQIEEFEEESILDGKRVWVNTIKTPVRDKSGEIVGLLGIFWDITERKLAQEEIRKLNFELEDRVVIRTAQLEASNRELEAFSYSVSHDLRAPLRHVSGYVELLNKHFHKDLSEKGQHYLNSIADSVRLMGKLIDDLLRFSRTGRVEMVRSVLDMDRIIHEVKDSICKDNTDRNIEWILGKLPSVYGDESMISLVWLNLLNNAVKFTVKRSNPRIEVGVNEEKKEWIFFVRDNGVGFDMQFAHKLFGVFQRLHPMEEYEGTGIGLANVRRIISRHGGRTWAQAEPDKGAIFNFSIPK
jgi:PAS domain S-box-containing protein